MPLAFSIGSGFGESRLRKTITKHFGVPAGQIATAARQFPITARVDLQSALEDLFRDRPGTQLFGMLSPNHHETPALADTLAGRHSPIEAGPLQHDEIDVGESSPVRCLKNGLWLSREKGLPFAVMLAPSGRFGLLTGVAVEFAVPSGEPGMIKEMMRRCAQYEIESSQDSNLTPSAVDAALEEMLFASGTLNRRLLGGEEVATPFPAA